MTLLWSLISGNLAEIIAGLGLLIGAVWLRMSGRKAAKAEARIEGLEQYRKTTERMQDAPAPVDADDARARMRDRPRDKR